MEEWKISSSFNLFIGENILFRLTARTFVAVGDVMV